MDIEDIKKEYDAILKELSNPELISDKEKFEYLSRKKKELEQIIEKKKLLEEVEKKVNENKSLLAGSDPELISLAEAEIAQLTEKKKILEKEIEKLIKEKDDSQKYNAVIVEIRAGTGGEEAALFAGDLYRMYSKFAASQGWQQKVINSHPTELGGFKEIIFELKDGDVFSKMKYEGGVHRVQRIPKTEKSGRVHTSTASVAVLPKPKQTQIKIRPDEIKIEYFKSSGPGGQYVNKRMTAVRITHLPTGIVVSSQTERNQLQNKENALSILSARLLEKKQKEQELQIGTKRKNQIGSAKRGEKIRTYNFPQSRVTDHRIKKTWHNIEEIMDGKLEKIIEALQEKENKRK